MTFKDTKVRVLPNEICTNYQLKPNEKLLSVSLPFSKDPNGIGLVGIFTIPPTAQLAEKELINIPTSSDSLNYPPTHKFSVILHGKGGHKNYCYQAMLAKELASKLGMYSFRFDFRGCGDSQDGENPLLGRIIRQDVEDIDHIIKVFENGSVYDAIGINLITNSIIGHSRGGVAMFRWALDQQIKLENGDKFKIIPNLINCSARYNSNLLLSEIGEKRGGKSFVVQYRKGKYEQSEITESEVLDLGSQDLSGLKGLNEEFQVLSIYGLADHIVPVEDSSDYANLLGSRHRLNFVFDADHNFFGAHTIESPELAEKYNPERLPLTKKNKVNWNYKVVKLISSWLATSSECQRFTSFSNFLYSGTRWKAIDGISNFRDLGGWRTKDNRKVVKSGLIYRCANPSKVTERGKEQLKSLGIKCIYDLRSFGEFKKNGGLEIDGIEVFNKPVYKTSDVSPQALALRYKNLLNSWYTFKFVYKDILTYGTEAFKAVFNHLLDRPNEPIVFNCQAGKDRTGVMAMLILLLLQVDHHTIAKEYELTTVGLKSDILAIKKEFIEIVSGFDRKTDLGESFTDSFKNSPVSKLSLEEMFENLISSKYESMIATIEMFNQEFGGIETYMTEKLGFSEMDVEKLRSSLCIDVDDRNPSRLHWRHRSSTSSLL